MATGQGGSKEKEKEKEKEKQNAIVDQQRSNSVHLASMLLGLSLFLEQ